MEANKQAGEHNTIHRPLLFNGARLMQVMLSTFWHGSPGMLARSSGTVSEYCPARRQYCGTGEQGAGGAACRCKWDTLAAAPLVSHVLHSQASLRNRPNQLERPPHLSGQRAHCFLLGCVGDHSRLAAHVLIPGLWGSSGLRSRVELGVVPSAGHTSRQQTAREGRAGGSPTAAACPLSLLQSSKSN